MIRTSGFRLQAGGKRKPGTGLEPFFQTSVSRTYTADGVQTLKKHTCRAAFTSYDCPTLGLALTLSPKP